MLVTSLERVDDAQHLGGVTACRSWVGEDGADGLLRVDDEDRADGESNALGVDVGGILVVQHVVGKSNLPLLVADDRESQLTARDLIDVLYPAAMALNSVGAQTDELDVALGELGLELREGTQLGGADRGVVLRVGEQDDPLVANEVVELDWATRLLSACCLPGISHRHECWTYPAVVSASKSGATVPRRRGAGRSSAEPIVKLWC